MTPLPWPRGEPATHWGALEGPVERSIDDSAPRRMWRAFMTARCFVGAVLLLLALATFGLGQPIHALALGLSVAYFAATLLTRRYARLYTPLHGLGLAWLTTIGVDLTVFALLQSLQGGSINYTPLFVLPVLAGAVLGTVPVALGTTAVVTLLLLADAGWNWLQHPADSSSRFVQAALTGTGLFVMALLAHELALRLVREQARAERNRSTARIQAQVNDVVIETLSEGVLVIDIEGWVHAANPAARSVLGENLQALPVPFALVAQPAWEALAELAAQTFAHSAPLSGEVPIAQNLGAPRELRVRTRLTPPSNPRMESLCVMFLQDLRELEARIRTEKLAAMGRMSAAVAHEIRNPLAAITQASALLGEDLTDPTQRKLMTMVEQNAKRLARIVDDVLDVARARQQRSLAPSEKVPLDQTVRTLAEEWVLHAPRQGVLLLLGAPGVDVFFEAEHLRRILINLLDNAARYAGERDGSIQIATRRDTGDHATLQIWSDGAPLEAAVQRHLFEPFFSSESRSSGLGLFICRELCERHGATIGYERRALSAAGPQGNEFFVSLAVAEARLTQ